MSQTLKDVKLPKSITNEKDSILKRLSDLQEEYPQLKIDVTKSEPTRSASSSGPRPPEVRERSKTTSDGEVWYFMLCF